MISRRALTTVVSTVVAAGGIGLVAALPWFLGVSWGAIAATVARVPLPVLAALPALWFLGLVVQGQVLQGAMRGLSLRQALTLNLAGSAVSNVLPVGGPAGMGLGFAMARGWGFSSEQFASYTVATNLWNAVGKFVVGLGVLAWAVAIGLGLPTGLTPIVISASAFVVLIAGGAALGLRTPAAARRTGAAIDRLVARVRHTAPTTRVADWLVASRDQLTLAVREGWSVMSVGVVAYLVLQGVLLYACLLAVGAHAAIPVVAVAFAIERLISLAPITPGASGVAELGTVAALHFFGVDPVAAAAGVLLYRFLVFALEIPVGGAIALGWLHGRARRTATAPVAVPAPERQGVSA